MHSGPGAEAAALMPADQALPAGPPPAGRAWPRSGSDLTLPARRPILTPVLIRGVAPVPGPGGPPVPAAVAARLTSCGAAAGIQIFRAGKVCEQFKGPSSQPAPWPGRRTMAGRAAGAAGLNVEAHLALVSMAASDHMDPEAVIIRLIPAEKRRRATSSPWPRA